MPFGMEKLEWCGYLMVKNFEDMFIRFDRMYERDRHTDTQRDRHTPHDSIGRACIASCGKNCCKLHICSFYSVNKNFH